MDPDIVKQLSPVHAAALELEEHGRTRAEIAQLLDIDVSAVGPLLRVAHAKLAQLELFEMPGNADRARRAPS